MSAEHPQPLEGRVIPAADRFTKTSPADPPQDAIRLGRDHGAEVEKVAEQAPRRTAGEVTLEAAVLTGTGLAHIVQTVWDYQTAGEIAEQIRGVKAAKRRAKTREDRDALADELEKLRARRRQVAHDRHREHATIAGAVGAVAYPAGIVIGTLTLGPVVLVVAAGGTVGALYVAGRKARKELIPGEVASSGQVELMAGGAGAVVEPDEQPALDGGALAAAFRAAQFTGQIKVIGTEDLGDGATLTHFTLPAHVTVTMLRKKDEVIAGALGRDLSMIDITKEGAANRGSLWLSDRDPFEEPRPSPLLTRREPIDSWRDGIPVAWGKRGDHIALPITNQNTAIAGMTRSGKGVGAANLTAGASLDPKINLRIVAGKFNGEWDPYARTGVAATYFKPSPKRLLALIEALLADMDRRNLVLGELGKSKVTPATLDRVGGIELLIIDEVATYTREGCCPERDDILNGLIKLSSVAAGAGVLMVLITQYPEVSVIPQALAMNCGTRWAMRVDNATQSNAILGGGASSSGRDASKFDPPRPGLGWLVNPFAGVTDLARSFDLDEDERGEVTQICERAAELRQAAGRLTGQWDDPIEQHLLTVTGVSSAAGGPRHDGQPGRALATLTAEQRQQHVALKGALAAMGRLGRDAAQLAEMAALIGDGMTGERLGELLRAAGAGGTTKVTIPGREGRVNGYNRADLEEALRFFEGS